MSLGKDVEGGKRKVENPTIPMATVLSVLKKDSVDLRVKLNVLEMLPQREREKLAQSPVFKQLIDGLLITNRKSLAENLDRLLAFLPKSYDISEFAVRLADELIRDDSLVVASNLDSFLSCLPED
ncbi:MAG: hypothetical protein GXP43_01780, partial [bacterium]|nr:hypothetical protein [bacterium]